MSEAEYLDDARLWLRYAREDLAAAKAGIRDRDMAPRHICWLAQQAAEKAIKAVLVYLQVDFPKTHDLDALRNLLPSGWQAKDNYQDLAHLSQWAVQARYPGDWPEATIAEALEALSQAQNVYELVHSDLEQSGLRLC